MEPETFTATSIQPSNILQGKCEIGLSIMIHIKCDKLHHTLINEHHQLIYIFTEFLETGYIIALILYYPQLISTLMHYPCTVPLSGLANLSAFLRVNFANLAKSLLRQQASQRAPNMMYGSEIDSNVSKISLKPFRTHSPCFLDSKLL